MKINVLLSLDRFKSNQLYNCPMHCTVMSTSQNKYSGIHMSTYIKINQYIHFWQVHYLQLEINYIDSLNSQVNSAS